MTIQEVEWDSKFSREFDNGVWGKCLLTMTVCGVRKLRYITFYHGATCNQPVPTVDNNNQGNKIIKNIRTTFGIINSAAGPFV